MAYIPVRIHALPIREQKQIADGTIEVTLDLKGKNFSFLSGQYIRLTLPKLAYKDPRGDYRDFSIASTPGEGVIRIAMRVSDSGFKRSLFALPVGSKVRVTGPFGKFLVPEDQERPCVFIAGGIGITPFFSMLNDATTHQRSRRFTLIYANKNAESAAYLPELKALKSENSNIELQTVFGPIAPAHLKEVSDPRMASWYLAGPPAMNDAVKAMLHSIGVPDTNIRVEEFLGYEPGTSDVSRVFGRTDKEKTPGGAENHSRLAALLEALDRVAIVSETDPSGTILRVNDKFVEISKYPREELIGQNHRILKSGHHPDAFYISLWSTLTSGKVWRGQIKNTAKDGTSYWVDSSIAPIKDLEGNITKYIAVRFPITEQKELEEKIEQRMDELELTNRAMVGREIKMIELKQEIERLKKDEAPKKKPIRRSST